MIQLAQRSNERNRHGFTLIEMLVVITLIGMLMAFTLPAVNNALERARKASCASNLHQMGIAVQSHLSMHHIFPTGGWGYRWVGDPDAGYRKNQPGGWVYNLLPFLDQAALHDLGAGQPDKTLSAAILIRTPLPIMNCPSLHRATNYPLDSAATPYNIVTPDAAMDGDGRGAKTDYAINAGSQKLDVIAGPATRASGQSWGEPGLTQGSGWRQVNDPHSGQFCSGVSFERSEITAEEVRDGLAQTILIGEKFVDLDNRSGDPSSSGDPDTSIGNNRSMYAGYCQDNYRTTYDTAQLPRKAELWTRTFSRAPLRITGVTDILKTARGTSDKAFYFSIFGGVHSASCNFLCCDGSVHAISYVVDYRIFACMGHRNDGFPIDLSVLDGGSGDWK